VSQFDLKTTSILEPHFVRALDLSKEVLKRYPENIYFLDFLSSLNLMPDKRRVWEFYESNFVMLSEKDWTVLKAKVVPRFHNPQKTRRWQTAIDLFNEAIAYSYFLKIGCTTVEFIPETNDGKTPDIFSLYDGKKIACEVKTLNRSDDAIRIDQLGRSCTVCDQLRSEFFETKLRKTIVESQQKFKNFSDVSRVFFFVLNFDDQLHDYAESYFAQIEQWIQVTRLPLEGIICLDNSTLWRSEPLVLTWPQDLWKRSMP
jgi:hypothetical protein